MKRFFKVIAIFMIVILCAGSVSLLFDSGSSDKPSGPGTIVQKPPADTDVPEDPEIPACSHVDADDDSFCDKCGESFSDGQDLFGGNITSLDTFDEYVYFDDVANKPYMESFNPHCKYGTFTTEEGYAKFYTTEEDDGIVSDSFLGIYANDEREEIMFSSFDYMTIEFDIWTESEYISPTNFIFMGNSNQGMLQSTNHIVISQNSEGYAVSVNNLEDVVSRDIDLSEKLHITFVLKTSIEQLGYPVRYKPGVIVYINGEYFTDRAIYISEFYSFEQLRIYFPNKTVEADRSVCLDNVQVSTFGTSKDSYFGALDEAFNDHSIKLTECIDSVLYGREFFGGKVIQSLEFNTNTAPSGFVTSINGVGAEKYENGYYTLYTTDTDEGQKSASTATIYFNDDKTTYNSADFSYMTVDFDFWSDSDYITDVSVMFEVGAVNMDWMHLQDNGNSYKLTTFPSCAENFKTVTATEKTHVTFVLNNRDNGDGTFTHNILVYVDGKFVYDGNGSYSIKSSAFKDLKISMGNTTVEANKSFCLDNIRIATFGESLSAGYDGAIADLFENHSPLTECIDSVLYNPQK